MVSRSRPWDGEQVIKCSGPGRLACQRGQQSGLRGRDFNSVCRRLRFTPLRATARERPEPSFTYRSISSPTSLTSSNSSPSRTHRFMRKAKAITRVFGEGRTTPGGIYVRQANSWSGAERHLQYHIQDDVPSAGLDNDQPVTILSGADLVQEQGFQTPRERPASSPSLQALSAFVKGAPSLEKLSPHVHRRLAVAYGTEGDESMQLFQVDDPSQDKVDLLRVSTASTR